MTSIKNISTSYFAIILLVSSCKFDDKRTIEPKTIKIEHQCWNSECLNVDKFRNGDIIPLAMSEDEVKKADKEHKPIRRIIQDTIEKISYSYYNYYAVIDPRELSPIGFHIPSKEELETFIGLVGDDKSKLESLNVKSKIDTRYQSEENHLGGQRWWTTTPSLNYDSDAYSFVIGGNKRGGISMYLNRGTDKRECLLVRCLKDY